VVERTIDGKYRLEGVVGTGAFGTVFRAVHVDVGRKFAVKVLDIPGEYADRAERFKTRFLREARILGQLDHPNAVQVYDFGEYEGKPYFVMEFVEGRTLGDALHSEGPLGEHRVHRIAHQLLAALQKAHELGLVHRDLKPGNIMLVGEREAERVKVVDFGVAAAFRKDALRDAVDLSVTSKGSFVGTPRYAAPEQFTGDAVAASDVYAVGLLMWEMLVGQPAVSAGELEDCIRAHMEMSAWKLPDTLEVTAELRAVVERALQRRESQRYSSAGEMLADLEALSRASTTERPQPQTIQVDEQSPPARTGDLLVGKYQLGPVIGAGGFSRVYRAQHVDMQRTVAVKLLDLQGAVARTGGTSAADLQRRFSREARMISQLRHPNTITVYDFGVDEHRRWYIVMEYVDGTNLWATVRKEGAFEARRAARITRDVLRSLSEAHHLGILHRDLKPGNIMLSHDFEGNEVVKVLDFGIATVHDVGELPARFEVMKETRLGTFVGTPQYAAPEQFLGEKLSPGADLYAVGLMLWEMLAGRAAVEEEAFGDCLKMHMSAEPWSPPEGVPPGLSDILRGALEKRPADRYLAAAEMADDIERWLAGDRQTFRPAPTTQERWEPAFDYRAVEQPVIDPNLDDGFLPEFLRSDEDQTLVRESSQKRERPTRERTERPAREEHERRRRSKPTPAKLELDYDRMPSRREPVVREAPVAEERRFSPGSYISWAVGGLVALVGAAVIYSATRPEPEAEVDLLDEEPMYLDLDEPVEREEQKPARSSRYSSEGIVRAIRAGGWSVERTRDSTALKNVHQQSYRVRRDGIQLELEVVTTKSMAIAQKVFEDTRPPVEAVVFDNKVVRVFPSPKSAMASAELVRLLRRYHDLVAESEQEAQ
jgi:serine/threonine-protein kinase